MEFCLLRHGRTEANERRFYCGSTDLSLSESGRAALLELAEVRPLPRFDLAVVTSLRRTAETADLLLPDVPRVTVPGFSEMDFGRFEYKDHRTLLEDPDYVRWLADRSGDLPCPGGESRNGFLARVRAAFAALAASLPPRTERVCVVCHGGTVSALMESFCAEKPCDFRRQPDNGRGWLTEAVSLAPPVLVRPREI